MGVKPAPEQDPVLAVEPFGRVQSGDIPNGRVAVVKESEVEPYNSGSSRENHQTLTAR
jgi:hypothetical protein